MLEENLKNKFKYILLYVIVFLVSAVVLVIVILFAFQYGYKVAQVEYLEKFYQQYYGGYNYPNYYGEGLDNSDYENSSCYQIMDNSKVFEDEAKILSDKNGQWATSASASSSYGPIKNGDWSPQRATGMPNVFYYGDNVNAWAPLTVAGGMETLTLGYDNPIFATGVNIKESYGSGAIVKVELKDVDDNFYIVWEGEDVTTCLGYLKINFEETENKINGIKITLDTTKSPGLWTEIDAAQLVGE